MLALAAIAASESHKVIAISIGDASLNTDMTPAGVHMRRNRVMTSMIMQLDPSYEKRREPNDTENVSIKTAGEVRVTMNKCVDDDH